MNKNKASKTPERLLMGLAMGLAASLCVLEYGKPLMDQYAFSGIVESEPWIEEPVIVTLPKPPAEYQKIPKRVNLNTTEFKIVPDEIFEKPEPVIPEFVLDFEEVEIGDSISVPDLVIPPLPPYMLDSMPEFDGYSDYFNKNIRFPSALRDIGQEGDVWVEFAIGADGYIDQSSITILKTKHALFSKEVIRVIKKMPRWKPGKKHGKPVPVLMKAPVRFRLK